MSKFNLISATRALAFSGALSLFAASSSLAAFVPDGTPFPGLPLTGTANFGGTALFDFTASFQETLTPTFTGSLRTVVVQNGGGLLDFYYQISGITAPIPTADIFRLVIDGIDPFATGVVDYSTNGLTGIGSVSGVTGTKAATSADRDPAIGSGVGFNFGLFPGDGANLQAGDTSMFLIVRTNATAYTAVEAVVSGFGTAITTAYAPTAVTPVPEPGSALAGLAVLGACFSGALRRNRGVAKA